MGLRSIFHSFLGGLRLPCEFHPECKLLLSHSTSLGCCHPEEFDIILDVQIGSTGSFHDSTTDEVLLPVYARCALLLLQHAAVAGGCSCRVCPRDLYQDYEYKGSV